MPEQGLERVPGHYMAHGCLEYPVSEQNPILHRCSGNGAWAPNVTFFLSILTLRAFFSVLLTEKQNGSITEDCCFKDK